MNKKIYIISSIVILLDLISKYLLEMYLKLNEPIKVIKNFLYITLCHNKGAAWSILTNQRFLLSFCSLLALVVIYLYKKSFVDNKRNTLAFGLLFGGIIGNLFDRVVYGYVRDFIDIIIVNYDFPIFNIADMAIVIGIMLLIIAIIKGEDSSANSGKRRKTKN